MKNKLLKRIQYAIHFLEHIEEVAEMESNTIDERDVKDFEKVLKELVLYNAKLETLLKKEALLMLQCDLEEIDEVVGGSEI